MPTLTAKNITLNEVHRTLGFQRHIDASFEPFYIKSGNYWLMPETNIIDSDRAVQLLQVLKAICKLQAAN